MRVPSRSEIDVIRQAGSGAKKDVATRVQRRVLLVVKAGCSWSRFAERQTMKARTRDSNGGRSNGGGKESAG